MRKFPKVANRPALHVCLCVPAMDYVCPECEAGTSNKPASEYSQNIPEPKRDPVTGWVTSPVQPWREEDLPERLKGYGHRVADQDGGRGDEWILPEDDHEAQFMEAARILLDAEEV